MLAMVKLRFSVYTRSPLVSLVTVVLGTYNKSVLCLWKSAAIR